MLFQRMKNSSYTHVMYWNIAKIIIWTSWWKFSCRPLQKTVFLVTEDRASANSWLGWSWMDPCHSFIHCIYVGHCPLSLWLTLPVCVCVSGKMITAAYVPLPNYHALFPDAVRASQLVMPSTQAVPPNLGLPGVMGVPGMGGMGFQ